MVSEIENLELLKKQLENILDSSTLGKEDVESISDELLKVENRISYLRGTEKVVVIVSVDFTTASPLSQKAGMAFWGIGGRFRSLPGKCHYLWVSNPTQVQNRISAVVSASDAVDDILAKHDNLCTGISVSLKDVPE